MPTYEYKCPECSNIVEVFHGITQEMESWDLDRQKHYLKKSKFWKSE